MRNYPRWIFPLIVVLIVGVMVLWRVSAETWGRDGPPAVQVSDSERVLQFETIGDRVEDGTVSIFSGQRIIDFFRIQFPINPYIYSHSRQMDISPDRNYLITSNLELFQKIRFTVDDINVYKDNRNYVYEGVRLPDAYVMETDLSRNRIKRFSLPTIKHQSGDEVSRRILPIRNPGDLKALNRLDSIPGQTSLLAYEGTDIEELTADQFERLEKVYVIEKNARRVEPDERLSGSSLMVLSERRDVDLRGPVPPIPWFVHWGSIGLVTLCLFLVSSGGITWICWLLLVIVGMVAGNAYVGLVLGLLGGAILRLVEDNAECDGVYVFVWPLLVFGTSYLSYLVWPYAINPTGLLVGLAGSVCLFFGPVLFSLDRTVRFVDLMSIGLITWVVQLAMTSRLSEVLETGPAILWTVIALTAVFPVLHDPGDTKKRGRLWSWMPAIVLWSVIPLYQLSLPYLGVWPLIMALFYYTRPSG